MKVFVVSSMDADGTISHVGESDCALIEEYFFRVDGKLLGAHCVFEDTLELRNEFLEFVQRSKVRDKEQSTDMHVTFARLRHSIYSTMHKR